MLNLYFLIFILFFIGFFGVFLARRNLLLVLMSLEIMLLAISILFILDSLLIDDMAGQLFALFIIAIGAAEVAVGLSLLIVFFRLKNCITIEHLSIIKGTSSF